MIDRETSALMVVTYPEFKVHQGKMHRANYMWSPVAVATGCTYLIDVPAGTTLHYSASYYSKFGGYLKATTKPTVSALGTEFKCKNNMTNKPCLLKSKFYADPTATHNTNYAPYFVGLAGGSTVAGGGSSGNNDQRLELNLVGPSQWLVTIYPYANDSLVILNAEVYE